MSIRKGTSIIAGNISQNIDSEFSLTSNNPVKNSVITNKLEQTLDYKNITNCITEISQDIKLELSSDGTLTLKAGSKVYVPNGAGVFDTETITSDLTLASYAGTYQEGVVWTNSGVIDSVNTNKFFSGSSTPTFTGQGLWYDTANNICKISRDSGSTWEKCSLPLCLCTVDSGTRTQIQQTFNGFGYVGSTVFALPGVKGLIPNGRNHDGSLNSITFVLENVLVEDLSDFISGLANKALGVCITLTPNPDLRVWLRTYSYNSKTNYYHSSSDNSIINMIEIGTIKATSTSFNTFIPRTVFQAVDYNDTEYMTKGALSNIVNGSDKKVGDVYYTSAANNTSVYAPSGGKWLILYVVEVNISTAVLYLYSDDLYHKVGEIVNGGTQITQARNGYGAYVSLLKIA